MTESLIKNILSSELFGDQICESLDDYAILDFFYKEFLLERFLIGEPIAIPELRKLLRKNIINFEFIKLDGEVRPARGTTMSKYIPPKDHPKGIRPSSDAVATFYDLDKDAWRSVSKKSREIVFKKDTEKDRPIIIVKDKDETLKKNGTKIGKSTVEKIDDIAVDDIRNYLNINGKTIVIRISRMNDDGSLYAETFKEKTPFKITVDHIRNIGEKLSKDEIAKLMTPNIKPPVSTVISKEPEPEMKPVTPSTPDGQPEKKPIVIDPIKTTDAKEQPKEIEDEKDLLNYAKKV